MGKDVFALDLVVELGRRDVAVASVMFKVLNVGARTLEDGTTLLFGAGDALSGRVLLGEPLANRRKEGGCNGQPHLAHMQTTSAETRKVFSTELTNNVLRQLLVPFVFGA